MKGDVVIGLEVHAELNTASKLFCSCPTQGDDAPNTRTCPVCLGHPGSKPVANKKAIEHTVKLALALNCRLAKQVIFSRKSYFYPDLAKNYQITQYEVPIGEKGSLVLGKKNIGIKRVHIEEDPAAMIHPGGIGRSSHVLVDYNRSGNPLVEIVTKPDMSSPEEARAFMKKLITILRYIDAFDPAENIIKADANVSIKETGYKRAEIKNITGFREIERALEYEIERQKHEKIEKQETRAWDAEKGTTQLLRQKETEEDYGYIFDPDLVPINVTESMKKGIPELPDQKYRRYLKEYKIKAGDAEMIVSEFMLSELFEKAVAKADAQLAARWIREELMRVLNYNKTDASEMDIDAGQFIVLLEFLDKKKITEKTGREVLEKLAVEKLDVRKYVGKNKLEAVVDANRIEKFCLEAIKENPEAVDDYRSGKEHALNFLLGNVMKKSKGKADPKEAKDMLKKLI